MAAMGPEALWVKSKIDYRAELAQFAHVEFSRRELREVEERIRLELDVLPVRRSAARRLLHWGAARPPGQDLPIAAAPAVARVDADPRGGPGSGAAVTSATFAVLPPCVADDRPKGARGSVAAVPALAHR